MVPEASTSDYLLDTNVISEWTKDRPASGVIRWLDQTDEDRTRLSVASLAELRYGVERLPVGVRRTRLTAWLDGELIERFAGRILVIDQPIAILWGLLMARAQAAGRTPGAMDAWFAATALYHRLTLVTRNVRDFDYLGVPVLNPWQERR